MLYFNHLPSLSVQLYSNDTKQLSKIEFVHVRFYPRQHVHGNNFKKWNAQTYRKLKFSFSTCKNWHQYSTNGHCLSANSNCHIPMAVSNAKDFWPWNQDITSGTMHQDVYRTYDRENKTLNMKITGIREL